MNRSARRMRFLLAGTAGAAIAAVSVAVALPTLAAIGASSVHVVTSMSALQSALNSAVPGDVIQLADGSYSTSGTISITKAGTASAPITVQAQHVGGAQISGGGGFSIAASASYVAL